MSVFHVPSVCANAHAHARVVGAIERLCEHVGACRTRPLAGEDFECSAPSTISMRPAAAALACSGVSTTTGTNPAPVSAGLRNRRRHVYNTLGLTPWRCATTETESPER